MSQQIFLNTKIFTSINNEWPGVFALLLKHFGDISCLKANYQYFLCQKLMTGKKSPPSFKKFVFYVIKKHWNLLLWNKPAIFSFFTDQAFDVWKILISFT